MTDKKEENSKLYDKLDEEILEAKWDELAPHYARGALLYIGDNLDLAEVGEEIANDNVEKVKNWMDAGFIFFPDDSYADAWTEDKKQKFEFLIIQPYVLFRKRIKKR